ncbi:MAG: SprB repeat-containing protein, partial [Bacteroidota bacterium]
ECYRIQCHGDSTVSLLANITNGVAPFSYNWEMTTYPDTNELNNVPAGEYILEVTDDAGCTARDTVNVSEPEDLILSCTPTGESSSGANDGSIAIGFTGAGLLSLSGDLTAANITNADSPLTFNNLAPGNYTLTLTDENGCTETCMAFVNPGGCDMTVDLLVTQPNCSSPDTGRITAIVTGGTAPYSYAWTGNTTSTTNFADDVTAGNYILIVTDDLGCTAIADTTINQFMDFPFLVVSPSEMICPDDCAPFDLSPLGIAPFSVSYRIIEDLSGVPLGQSNLTIVNPGDTSIVVCPGDFGLPSLADHTVEFFIIGDQICDAEFSITRSTLIRPLATDTVRTTHCAGDVVTIAGQDFMSGNERGEITLPDASVHGCDSLVVVDLTFLDAVTSTVDTMVCLGGSVTLEGNVFDAVTPTGSFTSATPSSIGCDSVVTVSLGFFPELIGNLDSTVCRGGSISIGGQVFDDTNPAGQVIFPGASSNGCDSTLHVNLNFFPPAISDLDTTICAASSLTINGQVFDTDTPSGQVVFQGASNNGCDSLVNVNLSFFPEAIGNFDTIICETASVTINGQTFNDDNPTGQVLLPGASINGCDSLVNVNLDFFDSAESNLDTTICLEASLTLGGQIFDVNNPNGDVILPGASSNGCDSIIAVNLSFFEPAVGAFDTTICENASVTIGGMVFDATTPNGAIILPGASSNGCDSTVNVNLSFFPLATGSLDTTICENGSVSIGGVLFDSSNPTGEVILPNASSNGCDSLLTVNVSFFPPAMGTLDTIICENATLTIGGTLFDMNSPTGSVTFPGAAINGCDSLLDVTVSFFPPAMGTLSPTICENGEFIFGGETFNATNPTGEVTLPNGANNGCDSIVAVSLNFFPEARGMLDTTLCPGESFVYQGQTFGPDNPIANWV